MNIIKNIRGTLLPFFTFGKVTLSSSLVTSDRQYDYPNKNGTIALLDDVYPQLTSVKTTNYTAVKNDFVLCDTTSSGFTVTLPASPSNGDKVGIIDIAGTFGTNTLIVGRNGNLINGAASNYNLTTNNTSVVFIFVAGYGWRFLSKFPGQEEPVGAYLG